MKQTPLGPALLLGALLGAMASCANPASTTTAEVPAYQRLLYLADTSSGHVGTFDPAGGSSSASSLVTTANSAGDIQFYRGIGYVAVGSGTGAGVYTFDPSSAVPTAARMPSTAGKNAQYFVFLSATKAYVSVVTSFGDDTGELLSFNPSNLSAGATAVDAKDLHQYFQEVAEGTDGMVYVTANVAHKVFRVDPQTDEMTATFTTSAGGTTGVASGTYQGAEGVFVTNSGSYGKSDGTIDFIGNAASTGTLSAIVTGLTNPTRILPLSENSLVVTGYSNNTYLVSLSTSSLATEVKSGGASFGGGSLSLKDGLIYIPSTDYAGNNKLYVFSTAGTMAGGSPFTVMPSGTDSVTNAAFYR